MSSFDRKKTKDIQGTFNEKAFQLSFVGEGDKLKCGMFSGLGFPCVPTLGCYGENYAPATAIFLLESRASLEKIQGVKVLPKKLIECLEKEDKNKKLEEVQVFLQIHPYLFPQPCQHFTCDSQTEISVTFHSWLFSGEWRSSLCCFFLTIGKILNSGKTWTFRE